MRDKFYKRVVSAVLAVFFCFSIAPTPVYADSNANIQAMISFFEGVDADAGFDDESLRIFGTFVSNFYTPYVTDSTNITECIEQGIDKLSGNNSAVKNAASDLTNALIANIIENSEPLKNGSEQLTLAHIFQYRNNWTGDTSFSGEKGALFALESAGVENGNTYRGAEVTEAGGKSSAFCDVAVMYSLMAGLTRDSDKVGKFIASDSDSEGASRALCVTPFGDIITMSASRDFTIIVPACLNPYTFSIQGNKLPMANRFYMSSLAQPISANENGINNSLVATGAPNGVFVYGVGLGRSDIANSSADLDKVGYYFKFDQKKLYDLARAYDKNSAMDMFECMNKIIANRYFYADTTADSLSQLSQGMLFVDMNGFVSAEELDKYSLQYIFSTDLDMQGVVKSGGVEEETGDEGVDDGGNDTVGTIIGVRGIGKKKAGQIKIPAQSGGLNTYTVRNFTSKVSGYDYYFLLGMSSTVEGIAYRAGADPNAFTCYMQVFYTYMLNKYDGANIGLNPNLPKCDASAVSNIADKIASGVGVDTDSQELAKKLMKRMEALTDDGMSDTKASFLDDWVNSFIIKCHRKMLGISDTNITSVSTNNMLFAGFTGHVTTPTLTDISFTAGIVKNYRTIYMIMMGLVILFLAIMFITKTKSWKQCLSMLLVMAICFTLPLGVINGTISLANSLTSNLYNNRFNYWAILQHQQELSAKFEAGKSGSDLLSVITDNLLMNNAYYSEDGVKLRWMAPRKEDVFDNIFGNSLQDSESANGLINGAAVFKMLFSGYFKGESYSTDAAATYVYRTYMSISDEAKELAVQLNKGGSVNPSSVATDILSSIDVDTTKRHQLTALSQGIPDKVDPAIELSYSNDAFRYAHMGNSTITGALCQTDVTWGSGQVGFQVPSRVTESEVSGTNVTTNPIDTNMNAYILYSESPFYYFYNVFLNTSINDADAVTWTSDSGAVVSGSTSSSANTEDSGDEESADLAVQGDDVYVTGFLPILLSEDLYKVTDTNSPAYGQTKDFLDLEGLFTYVVPYMYQGNTICNDFITLRGTDYRTWEDTANGESTILNTKDDVHNMWNMYCPWVDTLYNTKCLNDTITIMGKRYIVGDAFNPAYYHSEDYTSGRDMVFGQAEMTMAGVSADNLTDVEQKINRVLNRTYEDMRYLANYSAFSDDVLITAAAMLATFNFNKEFSEVNLFGNSYVMYPQGYELKTFSYDAFLRLILLNSTGISVMSSDDIYTTVIENTSVLTGISLLALDFVAVYVVPAAKLIFLVGVFVLSVLMLLTCFLQGIENAPKTIVTVVLLPMIKFLLVTLVHAVFTAMLMGEGLTELVGSQHGSIVTNDPTVTILLLLGINAVAAVFYVVFIAGIIKEGTAWLKSTLAAATGLIKNLVTTVSGKISDFAATGTIESTGLSINNSGTLATAAAAGAVGGAAGGMLGRFRNPFRGNNQYGEGYEEAMSRQSRSTLSNVLNNMRRNRGNMNEPTEQGNGRSASASGGSTRTSKVKRLAQAAAEKVKSGVNYVKGTAVGRAVGGAVSTAVGNAKAIAGNVASVTKNFGSATKAVVVNSKLVRGAVHMASGVKEGVQSAYATATKGVKSAYTRVKDSPFGRGAGVAFNATRNLLSGQTLRTLSEEAANKVHAKAEQVKQNASERGAMRDESHKITRGAKRAARRGITSTYDPALSGHYTAMAAMRDKARVGQETAEKDFKNAIDKYKRLAENSPKSETLGERANRVRTGFGTWAENKSLSRRLKALDQQIKNSEISGDWRNSEGKQADEATIRAERAKLQQSYDENKAAIAEAKRKSEQVAEDRRNLRQAEKDAKAAQAAYNKANKAMKSVRGTQDAFNDIRAAGEINKIEKSVKRLIKAKNGKRNIKLNSSDAYVARIGNMTFTADRNDNAVKKAQAAVGVQESAVAKAKEAAKQKGQSKVDRMTNQLNLGQAEEALRNAQSYEKARERDANYMKAQQRAHDIINSRNE